jgi:hypothetical protein
LGQVNQTSYLKKQEELENEKQSCKVQDDLNSTLPPRFSRGATPDSGALIESLIPRWYLTALGKVINYPSVEVKSLKVHLKQRLLLLGRIPRDLRKERRKRGLV